MRLDTPRWLHDQSSCCIRLEGTDVRKYLQTKLTRNVLPWKTAKPEYAMAVNINGQVLFDGEFLFVDDQTVDLWIDENVVQDAVLHLEKYVITEDVSITRTNNDSWVVFCDDETALDNELDSLSLSYTSEPCQNGSGYVIRRPRSVIPSVRVANPAALSASLPGLLADREQIDETDVSTAEVTRGFPRYGQDFFREKTIPLEAGVWEGIDFNKGCYLGQEVIERLHSRGTPARRLAQVSWHGSPVPPQTELTVDGRNAGLITRCTNDGDECVGLAYIRRKYLENDDIFIVDGPDTPLSIERVIGSE